MKRVYSKSIPSMTSHLDINVILDEQDAHRAESLFEAGYAEADRLIAIISAWQEGTDLYRVNQQAGIGPVKVDLDLFNLIKRSFWLSDVTGGLFDVTFASLDKIWYFDRPMETFPTDQQIKNSVKHINYRFIELDDEAQTVFIRNKGTKIELGATGKGFIAKAMMNKLKALGTASGLINAGGDLVCWGLNEKDQPWNIGIVDPNTKKDYIAFIPVVDKAVATSGCYERFIMHNNKRYSHIIHPKTGYPVEGLLSVTVISNDCELSDAIATTLFLMGKEKAIEFAESFADISYIIMDENEKLFFSENLAIKNVETK
ncbi:FAD:protein FMN transferase [Fluviicola sp.]|uniref:FAD:protein FMN transferase n=1 Tax=Fluviicola sp. TaxID=1917219 RepID=UPI0031DE2C9F